jgi:hypothetical protein
MHYPYYCYSTPDSRSWQYFVNNSIKVASVFNFYTCESDAHVVYGASPGPNVGSYIESPIFNR